VEQTGERWVFIFWRAAIYNRNVKAKKNLIVIGPRVLIKLDRSESRTDAGLYLPPTVKERDEVQSGFIVKTGPGYPVHDPSSAEDEPWAVSGREPRYIPLEAKEGDYALFLKKDSVEIEYEGEKYQIVPHSSILAIVRTEIVEE